MQDAPVATSQSRLETLYREHSRRLLGAVLAFAGDREVAMDAVSEAFAQALRRGDAIRSPLPWVWRAAFRIAAGMLKSRGREEGSVPETSYEMPERAWELLSALRRLPAKQRASVVLHYYGDYPVKEVAAIIGSTSPAVRMHLTRGRQRLRQSLEASGD